MKSVHLVIGVRGTGSASLTWPEDFDIVAAYTDEAEAREHALSLNNGRDPFEFDEDFDNDDDRDDDDDGETYDLQYQTIPVPLRKEAPLPGVTDNEDEEG